MLISAEQKEKRRQYMKTYNSRPDVRARKAEVQRLWRASSNYDWRKYYYKSKKEYPEVFLWKQAKRRAKAKHLEFTITVKDIVIPELCPIMQQPLRYIIGEYSDYSPSIDRIDSTKGYTPDNIQVISSIANRMKWNSTKDQLIAFALGVLECANKL